MCEHSELVAEMPVLEKMSTQERLKLARKRRMQQLKKWNLREKDYNYKKKNNESYGKRSGGVGGGGGGGGVVKKRDYKVHFVPSVMLLEAAARNDVEEVRRLLMLGVSPDSTNEDGLTALHQCCIDDSEEMMKILIEFGANINAQDSEQWTPLHAAATCGLLHLVRYLISKGADLLAVNADGNMPYDICEDEATLDFIESEMAKRGITQEMIDETRASVENRMLGDLRKVAESGGDLEFRDVHGATPLHIAAANGYSVVVEFLLDNHVSTDVIDNDLWQPIHAAACWGHVEVLEQLVRAGDDLSGRTANGETPLEICEDPDLKRKIIELRYEIEAKKSKHFLRSKKCYLQNTRSQSVRRTTLREKSKISQREAQEEARFRIESLQNVDENEPSQANNCTNNQNNFTNQVNKHLLGTSTSIETIIQNKANGISLLVKSNVNDTGVNNDSSSGIDDLKKHRADLRHRNSLSPGESPKSPSNDRETATGTRSLRKSNSTTCHTKVSDNKKDSNDPCDSDDSKLSHVLEIYDFPSDVRTQDLVTSLALFNLRDFDIKWVDDSHALAVFSSQAAAKEAMSMPHNNIRLRPLNEGIKESKVKAQKCAEFLLPYKQRPQTSAILARRLITGALGIRSSISSEQRAAEKKRLQEAKEKRRSAIKLNQDAWEGNVN